MSPARLLPDWATFARGYNGPGYRQNAYDTKMAGAFQRYASGAAPAVVRGDGTVLKLQQRLTAHGFPVATDGIRGSKTNAALKAFQKARGLVVDGIAGSATWAALDASEPAKPALPIAPGKVAVLPPDNTKGLPAKNRLLAFVLDIINAIFGRKEK
ncbi:peptidoglycan-binding domain-containing protein [Mesorhizobium marinum]|uniref:peptidoglycan-binding domain-containing protein n=1 Tax=Mesorhizobium marinum TaxID=3228790 RepID=UPI003467330A